jgi:hypothetical protein
MKATLLRSLRANRPHAPARAQRRMLAILRAALADPGSHLAITPAGVSLCWADDAGQAHCLSGHGLRHLEIALPLLALGCPAIDTRPCANRRGFIGAVLAAPWPRDHRALDRAGLAAVIAYWRSHGAAIINAPGSVPLTNGVSRPPDRRLGVRSHN